MFGTLISCLLHKCWYMDEHENIQLILKKAFNRLQVFVKTHFAYKMLTSLTMKKLKNVTERAVIIL